MNAHGEPKTVGWLIEQLEAYDDDVEVRVQGPADEQWPIEMIGDGPAVGFGGSFSLLAEDRYVTIMAATPERMLEVRQLEAELARLPATREGDDQ